MTAPSYNVWIVDDDASIRWVLERALEQGGFKCRSFGQTDAALKALRGTPPDVLLTDIRMPGGTGLELLAEIHESRPDLPVIVMTAYTDLENAVATYRAGAFDYLPKPFDVDVAIDLVRRAVQEKQGRAKAAEERAADESAESHGAGAGGRIPGIIGSAPAMQQVFRVIGRLSRSSISVLITGESGTGKELVARALHEHSPRARKPFIALNTSAIPSELLESELFGHEKGAFTGAEALRHGRFEQADGGALFLDEIGDMSLALQTRLLRVLAEGEFYRVGGQTPIKVDVRVIAATHRDLETRVATGEFREDLLHRLNVIRIPIPPLRERREDIPELLRHYLGVAARELDMETKQLTPAAEQRLIAHDWSGNVRELVNVCRRLTVTSAGREIEAADVSDLNTAPAATAANDWKFLLSKWAQQRLAAGSQKLLDEALPDFERALIRAALAQAKGLRQDAARLLGWGRNTLTRKMRELKLED